MRRWWSEPRSRLVAVYVGLVVLFYVVHAIPGGVHYRSAAEYPLWIAVDAILIVYIAKGSRVAIAIPLVLDIAFTIALVLTASASDFSEWDFVAFLAVIVAQSAVLLRLLFWRSPEPAPVA